MNTTDDTNAARRGSGSNDLLGQASETPPLVARLREMSRRGYWPLLGDEAADEIERLRADLKAMEGFADLWYFVSDEAPLEFEKIVAEYSPGRWLGEAAKLRAAKRGA